MPSKRVPIGDVALTGAAKPPVSIPVALSAPSQAEPAPAPRKASPQPQRPSSLTRGIEPLTPPNERAGPEAAMQQPSTEETSTAKPPSHSTARGGAGPAANDHQQPSARTEAVPLHCEAAVGGASADHAVASPGNHKREADGDHERANAEQQPAERSGAVNGIATPKVAASGSNAGDLRQHPAPPSPRKWWFGLSKRTLVA